MSMHSAGNSTILDKVNNHLASVMEECSGLPFSDTQSTNVAAFYNQQQSWRHFTYEKLTRRQQELLLGSMFLSLISKVKTLVVGAKTGFMSSDVNIEACSIAHVIVPWAYSTQSTPYASRQGLIGVQSTVQSREYCTVLHWKVLEYVEVQVPGTIVRTPCAPHFHCHLSP